MRSKKGKRPGEARGGGGGGSVESAGSGRWREAGNSLKHSLLKNTMVLYDTLYANLI